MGSSEDTKDGGAEKLVLSWKEFGDLAGKLADRVAELDKGKFDLVVAMARGGIPLAMFVADKLQIAVDFMRVKSYKSLSNKTEPKLIFDVHTNIKGMKILVVDDLADTGDTLAFAVKHLKEKCEAGEIITAAMFLKPRSAFTPDLYVRAIDTWVVFPWELGESGLLDLQKQQIENNKLTVYIANPLGFSHAGKHYLNTVLLPALSVLGVNIVNPWEERASQGTRSLKGVIDGKNLNDVIAIGMNNIEGLKRSDVVLAVLDGPDVDSGTAGEIGFAYGLGKLILGYRGDARVVTDAPSTKINLQIETFIRASGGSVYDTIEEAIAEINRVNASRNASRYKEEALTGS